MLEHHTATPASHKVVAPTGDRLAGVIDRLTREHQHHILPALRHIERLIIRLVYEQGLGHFQLAELARCHVELAASLAEHIREEEAGLFPALRTSEQSHDLPSAVPRFQDRICRNEEEHHALASVFQLIRDITDDYQPPHAACRGYARLLNDFAAIEATLRRHWDVEERLFSEQTESLHRFESAFQDAAP